MGAGVVAGGSGAGSRVDLPPSGSISVPAGVGEAVEARSPSSRRTRPHPRPRAHLQTCRGTYHWVHVRKGSRGAGRTCGWVGACTHRAAGWVDGALMVGRSGRSADGPRGAAARDRRVRGGGRGAVAHWPAGLCTRHARGWGWQVTTAGLEQAGPWAWRPGDPTWPIEAAKRGKPAV